MYYGTEIQARSTLVAITGGSSDFSIKQARRIETKNVMGKVRTK